MRMISPFLAVLLVAGCTELGTSEAPIIGGAPAPDDDAVVMLVSWPQDRSTFYTCSGVLIAPDAVLTVAHCIDAASHGGYTFGVFLGEDANAYTTVDQIEAQVVAVASVHPYPQYDTDPPFSGDIGVVKLAAAVSGVTPLPIARTAPTQAMVGQPARIVGYGQTVYGTNNARRYAATTTVAGLDAGDTVRVGDTTQRTCLGDSGGPALVTIGGVETVIGIDSYTDTPGCTGAAHFRRTDAYLPFLDAFLPQAPGPDAGTGPDAGDPGADSDGGGCCGAGGGGRGSLVLAMLVLLALVGGRRHVRR